MLGNKRNELLDEQIDYMNISASDASLIRSLREQLNLSHEELALATALTVTDLLEIENRTNPHKHVENRQRVLMYLKMYTD